MSTLHPGSFVETGDCNLRRTRSQPNRETSGVLLNECVDKYIAQFDLPFRNIVRYAKEIDGQWEKLSPQQQMVVAQNSQRMLQGLNTGTRAPHAGVKEGFGAPTTVDSVMDAAVYLSNNPENDIKKLLDIIYNSDSEALAKIGETKLEKMRKGVYDWVSAQSVGIHCNWMTGLLFFLFIFLFLLIGFGVGCYT